MNQIVGLLLSYFATLSVVVGSQLVAFERGTSIWIANIDGSNARKIAEGSGPDLSPDGSRVVFNTDDSSSNEVVREIAIADLATKKVTVINGIPSKNCQRALWSPNGKQILFTTWNGNDWDIALISPDGSAFRYVRKSQPRDPEKKGIPKPDPVWSTAWAMDGNSFFTQDLDYLYRFNLEGSEVKKWKLDSLFPAGGMNSGSRITSSPDGKSLLVEVDMDEEVKDMPDWDGPPPALWTFDLESAKTTRLTKKGVLAASGCWLDNQRILFNLFSAKEKKPAIYQMEIGKKEMKPLIKDGVNPSVSRASSGG